jgi:hypothetical protein
MADFVSSFNEGVQTGSGMVSRAQQLQLQQQQMQGIQALRQLQQQSMMLDMQAKAIELQQVVQNKHYEVLRHHAFLEVGEFLKTSDLTDPKTRISVLDRLAKVPMATVDPRYKAITEMFDGASKAKMDQQRFELDATKAAADLQVKQDTLALNREKMEMDTGQVIETFNPDGSVATRFTQGSRKSDVKDPNAPTTGTRTNLEGKMMGGREALAAGQRLKQLVTPDTVGVKGAFNRFVAEWGGQIPGLAESIAKNPKMEDAEKYVSAMLRYQSHVVKAMRTDPQISNAERLKWEGAGLTIRLSDSVKTAGDRLQETQTAIVDSLRRSALELGRPIPPEGMYPSELLQQYEGGRMDFKELSEALKVSPFDQEVQTVLKRLRELATQNARP